MRVPRSLCNDESHIFHSCIPDNIWKFSFSNILTRFGQLQGMTSEYSSDSDVEFDVPTVLLGVHDGDIDSPRDLVDPAVSRIGGTPVSSQSLFFLYLKQSPRPSSRQRSPQ